MMVSIHTPANEKSAPLIAIIVHWFVIKWGLPNHSMWSGIDEVNIRAVLKPVTINSAKFWTGTLL